MRLHDLEIHQHELEAQNRGLRETQAVLEASGGRYTDLYDFAPIGYVTLDARGRVLEANLAAAALFGRERTRLVGHLLSTMVPRSDRNRLVAHVRQCVSERRRVVTELHVVDGQKRTIAVQATSMPIVTSDSRVTGCRTALTDVSELRRSQDQLRFIAEAGVILASSLDPIQPLRQVAALATAAVADLCLVHVLKSDHSLERIVAALGPGVLGGLADPLPFSPLPPSSRKKTAVMKALEAGEAVLVPDTSSAALEGILGGFERETLGRSEKVKSFVLVPLVARGGVQGMLTLGIIDSGRRYDETDLGMARDLATRMALSIENARLFQDTRRAIDGRQEILSFVSHDLRSPLMGILLTTEAMLRSAPSPERRGSWRQLERIRRAVLQMSHMIDDLLDVSSLDAGHLSVTIGDYDTARLLEEAREMLSPLAAEKGLTMEIEPPSAPCRVRCDRDRILQVFSNLVGNAIKFTPGGGRVRIQAERSGGGVRIVIRDTGPGITPDQLPYVFERYWQADRAGRKGAGLGLYIAKGIVESQGGTIWAESADAGGATFCFTLPLVPPPEMERLRETMQPRRGPVGKDRIAHSG